MKLNIDPGWLLKMAEKEDCGIVSVGGWFYGESQGRNDMETMTQALEIANGFIPFSDEWQIFATAGGGWQLRAKTLVDAALINYLKDPSVENGGEVGKPYQVNCRGIANFATLDEALGYVWRRL
jgi:hypothetical protein